MLNNEQTFYQFPYCFPIKIVCVFITRNGCFYFRHFELYLEVKDTPTDITRCC